MASKLVRVLAHFPVGIVNVILAVPTGGRAIATLFGVGFLVYEYMQSVSTNHKDRDMRMCWGMCGGWGSAGWGGHCSRY